MLYKLKLIMVIITTIYNDFRFPSVAIVYKNSHSVSLMGKFLVLAKFINRNFLVLSHFLPLPTPFPYLPLCLFDPFHCAQDNDLEGAGMSGGHC